MHKRLLMAVVTLGVALAPAGSGRKTRIGTPILPLFDAPTRHQSAMSYPIHQSNVRVHPIPVSLLGRTA